MPPAPKLPVPGAEDAFLEFEASAPEEEIRQSRMTTLTAAKSHMSMVTVEEANRMAYKDMRTSLYLIGTLGFYAIVIVGSIIITSVTIIFDFAAAFAVSAIAFIFPALFYMRGAKRFGNSTKGYMYMSYAFFTLGCFNCALGITSTVLNILSGAGGE